MENNKNGKTLIALSDKTISGLVKQTNVLKIPREDVVNIIHLNDQFILLYYK